MPTRHHRAPRTTPLAPRTPTRALVLLLALSAFSALQPFSPLAFPTPAPAPAPPMGWNSFDSYGVYLHEKAALANLEAMAEKLKPYGYEYFVVDNGWFGEYKLTPGTHYAAEKHASRININEYGYPQPSKVYFPNGLAPLIKRCHELGLKFGVHLMRGIPRQAVEQNLPIEGTPHHARDIADTRPKNQCRWCPYNYAVDMTKPGAQAWYDGLIRHLAAQGVDFIKYDDIVPWPAEVEAVAKAIAKVDRPIMLSLSPGRTVDPAAINSFRMANMLRVTSDIWDEQSDIDLCFAAWRKWTGHERPDFWIDMDMIPFGELQIMTPPKSASVARDAASVALSGKGTRRWSQLSPAQMETFITLRALSASPLMMGGDLVSLDAFSLKLITDSDVIACNQNGIMGRLVTDTDGIEVWFTPEKDNPARGWLGAFNRTPRARDIALTPQLLGLKTDAKVTDIWNGRRSLPVRAAAPETVTIPANGALFLRLP